MRLLAGAAARLAAVLALATVVTAAAQGIADTRLAGPAATAFVTDRNGTFLTQAGHESARPGGGTVTQKFKGSWTLVWSADQKRWLLDKASITPA